MLHIYCVTCRCRQTLQKHPGDTAAVEAEKAKRDMKTPAKGRRTCPQHIVADALASQPVVVAAAVGWTHRFAKVDSAVSQMGKQANGAQYVGGPHQSPSRENGMDYNRQFKIRNVSDTRQWS